MSDDEIHPPSPEDDALERASAGEALSAEQAHDALDYFLGRKPKPNQGKTFTLKVDFGTLDEPAFAPVVFKALRVEDLNDADERAAIKNDAGEVTGTDAYISAAWVVARAQVTPPLGPILNERNQNGGGFPDAATLLQDLFAESPGTLLQTARAIRRRARIGGDGDTAVREVEAGKTSR